jgi:DNA repair protein RecO (recombination protein O)
MTSRERLYRTEAVVLRRQELGEADRLLTLYTPDHGKLRVVAKGVRLLKSRKAGHLELFNRVQLLIARGRELDVVTQADTVDAFAGIRGDLMRLGHAAYAVELVDCFAVQEENRPLYRLLVETIERLASGLEASVVVRYFELSLLDLLGYRPQLFQCTGCGNAIRPQAQYFSAVDGGVLCPSCGLSRRQARPISLSALKVLRHYQRSPFSSVAGTKVSEAVHAEMETLMEGYLTFLLERRLNTPGFLQRVRRLLHGEVETVVAG